MKKLLFICMMVVSLIAGGASMDAKTTKKTSKTKTSVSKTSSSNNNYLGTYNFTDAAGQRWILKLNSDKTATLECNGTTYYGWYSKPVSYRDNGNKIELSFSSDKPRPMKFEVSEIDDAWFPAIDLAGGYFYATHSYSNKNPKKRLKITKVK